MAYEILIWRDQLEGDKEDSKRCKAAAIKGSRVGAGLAREVGYAVRSVGPKFFRSWDGAGSEFHMDISPLADNDRRFARHIAVLKVYSFIK